MITVYTREDYLWYLRKYLPPNSGGVEIGCYRGDFSEQLLKFLNPRFIYLIDPFKEGGKQYGKELNNIQTAYSNEMDFEFVTNRFKDDRVRIRQNLSFNVVDDMVDSVFDFIYHDGSHLYEDIKRDLKEWLPKLSERGLMCGHDYIEHPDFGVIQAVDEFCKQYNFEMIIYNENGGDYALKRKL